MAKTQVFLALLTLYFLFLISGVSSATFTLVNQCSYTVWPGILSGAGTSQISPTGFQLNPGQAIPVSIPAGDCGSGTLECTGGAAPPATLAEFTLNGADGLDFYDVSLVDGYNLPMLITPQGGTGAGNCSATGCVVDLNGPCPAELKLMSTGEGGGECVACKSACEAFGDPMYCCSGAYATPDTCKPTDYSEFFKSSCPRAYSYAYDDGTSTFTCASADYVITFCPAPSTSQKSSGGQYAGGGSNVSLVSSSGILSSGPLPFLTSLMITILATLFL
ncbi:pathogenesis-related thaumatin-like protein 3.5 isoform X2 [Solanum dulcamara]|uniref:pathogenesis-related thaumatin-like protein 3.5 isoform X2 n=1 Tax=Solanum dulcamara TaxID=45834 RepID=UPI002485F708|nr:pathogenesis-related thaumatin-like protein 3.5 isoform X2 [Solanum dulcamara]